MLRKYIRKIIQQEATEKRKEDLRIHSVESIFNVPPQIWDQISELQQQVGELARHQNVWLKKQSGYTAVPLNVGGLSAALGANASKNPTSGN